MRRFTIAAFSWGTYAVVQPLPIAAHPVAVVYARADEHDSEAKGLRALVDQANAAIALEAALKRALAYERDCLPAESWESIVTAANAAIKQGESIP